METGHPRRAFLVVAPLVVGIGLAVGLAVSASSDVGGDGRDDPEALVDPVQTQLGGRAFESTSVTGHDLAPDTVLRLSFDQDSMAANAGCNTMTGPWTDEGSTLKWTEPVATTLKACPDALAAQDQWFAGLLTEGLEVVDGDADLTLESGDITIELDATD
jgi:heat shock protein HslJ